MIYTHEIRYVLPSERGIECFLALLLGSKEEIKSTITHYRSRLPELPFPRSFCPAEKITLPLWSGTPSKEVIIVDNVILIIGKEAYLPLQRILQDRSEVLRGALYKVQLGDDPSRVSNDISDYSQGRPGMVFLPKEILDSIERHLR